MTLENRNMPNIYWKGERRFLSIFTLFSGFFHLHLASLNNFIHRCNHFLFRKPVILASRRSWRYTIWEVNSTVAATATIHPRLKGTTTCCKRFTSNIDMWLIYCFFVRSLRSQAHYLLEIDAWKHKLDDKTGGVSTRDAVHHHLHRALESARANHSV